MPFFFIICTQAAFAQNNKKMAGIWEVSTRKAENPCKDDWTLQFDKEGEALMIKGRKYSECDEVITTFKRWGVEEKEMQVNGRTKKVDIIKLYGADFNFIIEIVKFTKDYMKVNMELRDLGTTRIFSYIFKKIEK